MNLFPSYVHVNDFTGTYPQVEYGEPSSPGYCHVKIDARRGRLIILCSEMSGYRSQSLYRGRGDLAMRRAVLDLLLDEAVLVSMRPKFRAYPEFCGRGGLEKIYMRPSVKRSPNRIAN